MRRTFTRTLTIFHQHNCAIYAVSLHEFYVGLSYGTKYPQYLLLNIVFIQTHVISEKPQKNIGWRWCNPWNCCKIRYAAWSSFSVDKEKNNTGVVSSILVQNLISLYLFCRYIIVTLCAAHLNLSVICEISIELQYQYIL